MPPPSRTRLSSSDVAMALVICVWGTNYVVVKQSLDAFPPLAFMALRFGLAAAAMLGVLLWLEGWPRLSWRTWAALGLLGLVGNTAYQLCFVVGLSRTTAANSGLLSAVTPVLVAALAVAFKLERLTRPLLVGLALALCGGLLVVASRGPELSADTRVGDALILCGSLTWALYTVGVKALGDALSPLQVTALTMLAGTPALLVIGAPTVAAMDLGRPSALAWAGVAYSALVPLVVAYVVWNRSVRSVGSARTALYNCGIPVVAGLTAWAVRGERPTWVQALGAVLVITGVLLSRRQPAPVPPPEG